MPKRKADVLEQKSPAEFFAENKNIAGFDNVSLEHSKNLSAPHPLYCNDIDFLIQGPAAAREVPLYHCQRACGECTGLSREHR